MTYEWSCKNRVATKPLTNLCPNHPFIRHKNHTWIQTGSLVYMDHIAWLLPDEATACTHAAAAAAVEKQ
jgi:hypothetical protein